MLHASRITKQHIVKQRKLDANPKRNRFSGHDTKLKGPKRTARVSDRVMTGPTSSAKAFLSSGAEDDDSAHARKS